MPNDDTQGSFFVDILFLAFGLFFLVGLVEVFHFSSPNNANITWGEGLEAVGFLGVIFTLMKLKYKGKILGRIMKPSDLQEHQGK